MAFNLFNNIVGAVQSAAQPIFASAQNRLQEAAQSVQRQIGSEINKFGDNIAGQLQGALPGELGEFAGDVASNFIGGIGDQVTGAITGALNNLTSPQGLNSAARSQNLNNSGRPTTQPVSVQFNAAGAQSDWRVKLSLPQNVSAFTESSLLNSLQETGGLVWPYTPTIIIGHSANYNSLHPVHTNYPFQAYQNSQTDDITITGDFTVQNKEEARYWIAAVHYLRSVTKMFYGEGSNPLGNPPVIVRLNGYGDYVFNNVPVVITNFTVDMQSDVDYIATDISGSGGRSSSYAWAPTQSLISVTVRPTYSRASVSAFSLNDFVNGAYVKNGTGFI